MLVAAVAVLLVVVVLAHDANALKFEHKGSKAKTLGTLDAGAMGNAVTKGDEATRPDAHTVQLAAYGFDYLSCIQHATSWNISMCQSCKAAMKPKAMMCELANCPAVPNGADDNKACAICRRIETSIARQASAVAARYCMKCALQDAVPCIPSICRLDAPCRMANQTASCTHSVRALCGDF